jgi:translocation and assembly module TamA
VLNEDYRIGSTRGSTSLLMPGVKGSLALADDVVNTENGLRVTVDISGASQDLLSEASFLKLRGDGKLILSPVDGWRLIGRGSIGGILVEDIDDIPPSLRFYAGGEKSVRGYRYRSLGPADDSGNVIGGRLLLTGSIEIERRLSRYWRAAAFYDVGNAMDDFEVDLVDGVGIGIGVALPFGRARLDLAYPLQNEGRSQAVYLSVGADL